MPGELHVIRDGYTLSSSSDMGPAAPDVSDSVVAVRRPETSVRRPEAS